MFKLTGKTIVYCTLKSDPPTLTSLSPKSVDCMHIYVCTYTAISRLCFFFLGHKNIFIFLFCPESELIGFDIVSN